VLTLALLSGGCKWLRNVTYGESLQIEWSYRELTLAWDPPVTDIPGRPTEVSAYQVYVQQQGSSYWRFLGEVPASRHPEYTVEHDLLGDGLYTFAVRAITASGQASALHASTDSSADPVCGWHVLWHSTE
jgi:hypothetical protein